MGFTLPATRRRVAARANVRRQPGTMNRTERAYSEVLEARRLAGEVAAWWYEGVTLKLAPDCRYTPDFLVQMLDGSLELVEVKAGWRKDGKLGFHGHDESNVKMRVASERFPFRVVRAVLVRGEGWVVQEMGCE